MVDNLKNLLENPVEDGIDEIRELFDSLFGQLSREERMSFMLFLAVPYMLNENIAMHIEIAAKYGKLPGPGSLQAVGEATVMQFASAIKASIQAGVRASLEERKNKGN